MSQECPRGPATKLSLSALAAMVTLPFLVPLYVPFFGDAYRGWLTMVLGMAAAISLLVRPSANASPSVSSAARPGADIWPKPVFPATATALLTLVAILMLQLIAGRGSYAETSLSGALYLLWAALLMVTVATLRQRHGLTRIADHLATWVLIGAVACAALGLLSFSGYRGFLLFPPTSGVAYGNLGQPNHFAHYLWLGVASLLYLRSRRRLTVVSAGALLVPILLASSLSGSRASLMYASLLVALAFWRGDVSDRKWALSAASLYAAFLWIAPSALGVAASSTALARLYRDAAFLMPSLDQGVEWVRPTLLRVAWDMFLTSPWLGSGAGGFRWHSYATADRSQGWQGSAEHAHNLFANLLGELGIAATLIVVVALLAWTYRLLRRRNEREVVWLAGMAGVALIHAQVEYPFWYPHFFGLFVVVMALGDQHAFPMSARRLLLAAIFSGGFVVLAGLGYDLLRMEALARPMSHVETVDQRNLRIAALVELRRGSLIAPQIDLALTAIVPPTRDTLVNRLALCRQSLEYSPSHPNAFTCALLHELAGEHERAERLWRLALTVFPREVERYVALVEEALTEDELVPLRRVLSIRNAVASG